MSRITERRIYRIAPIAITTDGTKTGILTVPDSSLFIVGQTVYLKSSTEGPLELKIKRVHPTDRVTMEVGPTNKNIHVRTDISDFLVADGTTIAANEQERPNIPEQEIERITYEEEPTVARRVVIVDKWGCRIDDGNPLPVNATIDLPIGADPRIFNVPAIIPGTEYSQLLPDNTLQFSLKARKNKATMQFSFTAGTTNSNFLTVVPGNIYMVKDLDLVSTTVYFQTNKDNTVVEIMAWI